MENSMTKQFTPTALLAVACAGLFFGEATAQQMITRTAEVTLLSTTPIEDIEGHNTQGSAIFDASNGDIAIQVPILGFHFKRALLEEHFNENYMESDKHPKAMFRGSIAGWNVLPLEGETVQVLASGAFTVHGVEVNREFEGSMRMEGGELTLACKFEVRPEDHSIEIPGVVREQIASVILLTVHAKLSPR
jgi:hypothetical protein